MSKEQGGYTEKEFALILAKATELAATLASADDRPDHISLEEAKAIAGEVGLDPAYVERAAYLVPQVLHGSLVERLVHGRFKSEVALSFPGELTRDRAELILAVVRSTFACHGEGEATASGVSWFARLDRGFSVVHVSAFREAAGTQIRVVIDNRARLFLPMALGPLGVFAVISIAVAVGPTGPLDPSTDLPWLVLAGGLPAVAAGVWRSLRKTGRATLEQLDRVVGGLGRVLRGNGAS